MACNLLALFMYFLCNQVFAYGAVAYSRQTGYTYVATEYGDSAAGTEGQGSGVANHDNAMSDAQDIEEDEEGLE